MTLQELQRQSNALNVTPRMPVLFIGHGSPMNAIENNEWSTAWTAIGRTLPKPRAILSISAHWLSEGTFVHIAEHPKTIHDFWGFPKELYDMRYPCPGSPEYAKETQRVITNASVGTDTDWGIDHGTWIVLHRIAPAADIPVFQLSIDISKPSLFHYKIGRELRALRDRGILIMGSGNIVHNLGLMSFDETTQPFDWAIEFDEKARALIESHNDTSLIEYETLGHAARLAVPTPDHYWPLLYILGARDERDTLSFPASGIAHGSVSMRAVLFDKR